MGELIAASSVRLQVLDEYLYVLEHLKGALEEVVEGRLLVKLSLVLVLWLLLASLLL